MLNVDKLHFYQFLFRLKVYCNIFHLHENLVKVKIISSTLHQFLHVTSIISIVFKHSDIRHMGKSDNYSKRCPFFGKAILIRW